MQTDGGDLVWAWLLATLLFVVMLGSGRTLRGRLLGRPPFGAGLALSAALGVFLFSMVWMGLGHFGALHRPAPLVVLALGLLLALPGLYWTWGDYRVLAPGLRSGFGPAWFAGGAWFLLIASLAISFFWISGVHAYGGIGFLFERAGFDWVAGGTFFDPDLPRDPFLGDEPLALWAFGLGAPAASLALAWWLGVAMLFGVCGLGWRLHHHGAGLAAAAVLAVALFAGDNPLFLAPALPAALALIAVMVLAVESRGRPHLGRSLVAGGLGGFALISDFGAAAMLLPLLLFGPSWCKLAVGLNGHDAEGQGGADDEPRPAESGGAAARVSDEEGAYDDDELAWDDKGFEDGVKIGGVKKWLTPMRHTAFGMAGLAVPLLPWLARNDAWLDDPWYGLERGFRIEADYRYYDFDDAEPGFQSGFGYGELDEPLFDPGRFEARIGRQRMFWGKTEQLPEPRVQLDPIFIDYDIDFGIDLLDRSEAPRSYLDATEWGLGLGLGALFAPLVVGGRRRRERLMYVLPALGGYSLGAYAGDFEATTPSALGLLAVGAGQALFDMKECRPPIRQFAMGGVAVTGGLSLGLSTANDCGYWPTWGDYPQFPQLEFRYDDPPEGEPPAGEPQEDEGFGWRVGLGYRWNDWEPKIGLGYEFEDEDPAQTPEPEPRVGLRYDWKPKLELRYEYGQGEESEPPADDWHLRLGARYGYDFGKGLELRGQYRVGPEEDEGGGEVDPGYLEGLPEVPQSDGGPKIPEGYQLPEPTPDEDDEDIALPRSGPKLPIHRPDIRPRY